MSVKIAEISDIFHQNWWMMILESFGQLTKISGTLKIRVQKCENVWQNLAEFLIWSDAKALHFGYQMSLHWKPRPRKRPRPEKKFAHTLQNHLAKSPCKITLHHHLTLFVSQKKNHTFWGKLQKKERKIFILFTT